MSEQTTTEPAEAEPTPSDPTEQQEEEYDLDGDIARGSELNKLIKEYAAELDEIKRRIRVHAKPGGTYSGMSYGRPARAVITDVAQVTARLLAKYGRRKGGPALVGEMIVKITTTVVDPKLAAAHLSGEDLELIKEESRAGSVSFTDSASG